ncbi:MAG: flavin reductase family protein [Spirochaetes bacterium]|nr:MAG: flavin reductase family protein [Spirochaetota bacterium]
MPKTVWKPGTMLYPAPAVLVTSRHDGKDNIVTVSWAGTVCTEPPMLSISLKPERLSYAMIRESGEFVVNLPVDTLARAVDFCGVKSGRNVDKFAANRLSKQRAHKVAAPLIAECPVAIECRVSRIVELGSHHMFIADVLAVNVEEEFIDRRGKLRLEDAHLLCYSHGQYFTIFKPLEKFGFSVRKKGRSRVR